jgi:hypothetical protein
MKKIRAWFEETPSPNEGRIKELREAIKKGRYPTRKMIRMTADELIARFEGKKAL